MKLYRTCTLAVDKMADQHLRGYQPRIFCRHKLCERAAFSASEVRCLHFVTGGVMFVTVVIIRHCS